MAYPVLLRDFNAGKDWFKSTTKTKPDITIIRIVDSYTPAGNETESWNADEGNSGSIKCYLKGTELIIAGNGSGKIAAPVNSSYLFSAKVSSLDNVPTFTNVTHFYGAELFDMSGVTTLARAFAYMIRLEYINVSNWDIGNVTSLEYIFGAPNGVVTGGMSLKELDVRKWNVSKVTTLKNAFLGCKELEVLDVSLWDVSSLTTAHSAFKNCGKLKVIDVGNWNVPLLTNLFNTFVNCENLRELDFSKWNAPNLSDSTAMTDGTPRLEKIKLSKNVPFTVGWYPNNPLSEYIEGADGKWHTVRGVSYDHASMPCGIDITYYASPILAQKVREVPVIISGQTAVGIANAIREKTGGIGDIAPSEFEDAIRSI